MLWNFVKEIGAYNGELGISSAAKKPGQKRVCRGASESRTRRFGPTGPEALHFDHGKTAGNHLAHPDTLMVGKSNFWDTTQTTTAGSSRQRRAGGRCRSHPARRYPIAPAPRVWPVKNE